jgi:hypothetical protein
MVDLRQQRIHHWGSKGNGKVPKRKLYGRKLSLPLRD